MDKNALINQVGMLIVTDPAVDAKHWDGYALIVRYNEGNIARRISGFRYLDDGSFEAATPQNEEALTAALDALREATRVEDKAPWDACVVRIRRDTRKVHVDFEYDFPARWDITPQTLNDVVENARPVSVSGLL